VLAANLAAVATPEIQYRYRQLLAAEQSTLNRRNEAGPPASAGGE